MQTLRCLGRYAGRGKRRLDTALLVRVAYEAYAEIWIWVGAGDSVTRIQCQHPKVVKWCKTFFFEVNRSVFTT